jgi:D-3-phosphoglycerate dehydrogenase
MTRPRILLAEPLDAHAETQLEQSAQVIRPPASDAATLAQRIVDCDAAIVRTSTPVTREWLSCGRRLRIVGVAGVGLDRVDVDAARELGIEIVHTPAAASDAVAELAVAFMLQLLRPIPRLAASYRDGQYRSAREAPHGCELSSLRIGVVGMGRIGSRVARICAAGFGARVMYVDIVGRPLRLRSTAR